MGHGYPSAPHRRPRQNASALPMLRSSNQEAIAIKKFVTQ